MIKENVNYLLIPKNEEGINLPSREMTGSKLLETVDEKVLQEALDEGTTFIFKGNEYFLDEAL